MANLQLKMIGESVETCPVKVNRSFYVKCLSSLLLLFIIAEQLDYQHLSWIDQFKMLQINITKHEGKGKLV